MDTSSVFIFIAKMNVGHKNTSFALPNGTHYWY